MIQLDPLTLSFGTVEKDWSLVTVDMVGMIMREDYRSISI
jgi:hypothetical protein